MVEEKWPGYGNDESLSLLKQTHGYVALNHGDEQARAVDELVVRHRMRKGRIVTFDRERYAMAELFLNAPMPNGCHGIPEAINWSVSKCESVLRKDLFGSIVLCGGVSTARLCTPSTCTSLLLHTNEVV
jgi:hypothetical protein